MTDETTSEPCRGRRPGATAPAARRQPTRDGIAGKGELAGQAVIPVPGVDDLDTAPPLSPHPSDGCGLCGWSAEDDPCPSHVDEVAAWDAAYRTSM